MIRPYFIEYFFLLYKLPKNDKNYIKSLEIRIYLEKKSSNIL